MVDSILSEGSHSVGGADDSIHGNETHDGTCEKKTTSRRLQYYFLMSVMHVCCKHILENIEEIKRVFTRISFQP